MNKHTNQRDMMKLLLDIIRKLQDECGGAVPIQKIKERGELSGLKEKEELVENMLAKLKSAGEIIEPSENRYRVR